MSPMVLAASATTGLDVNGAAGSETGLVYTYADGSIDISAASSIMGTDGDDSYYVRRSSAYDVVEVYSGTSAVGTPIYSAPLADIRNISFDTGAGNDQLIVDLVNGTPLPPGGINYAAGTDNDSLTVIGDGSGAGSYQPGITTGSGNFAIGASAIAFSGVEPVTASNFSSLSITTPFAGDVITIDKPAPGQNRVSGTSDGLGFSSLTVFDINELLVDTAAHDTGDADDSITITDGIVASGLHALIINAGNGTNVLAIQNGAVPLRVIDGEDLAIDVHNSGAISLIGSQALRSLNLHDSSKAAVANGQNIIVHDLTIAPSAQMDLNDGELHVGNNGLFSTIRSYIRNARNTGLSGLWSGNGLTSSFVAANSDFAVAAIITSNGDVLVRYALIGDLNLDNAVTISDFIDLAANFNGSGIWATGDLNYDDLTTISDFIDLASHFGQTYTPPSAPAFAPASQAIVASPTTSTSETSSSPQKGNKKKTHSRRVVPHHRPGKARPGISRHE